jgi:hypothetical protein
MKLIVDPPKFVQYHFNRAFISYKIHKILVPLNEIFLNFIFLKKNTFVFFTSNSTILSPKTSLRSRAEIILYIVEIRQFKVLEVEVLGWAEKNFSLKKWKIFDWLYYLKDTPKWPFFRVKIFSLNYWYFNLLDLNYHNQV